MRVQPWPNCPSVQNFSPEHLPSSPERQHLASYPTPEKKHLLERIKMLEGEGAEERTSPGKNENAGRKEQKKEQGLRGGQRVLSIQVDLEGQQCDTDRPALA